MSSVDKRTIHAVPARLAFRCYCLDAAGKCDEPLPDCTKYALVNPQELAALEAEAAKVATLTEACSKKDEALRDARAGLWDENPATWEHEICAIDDALELTPASVTQQAEEARIGRAVVDYINLPRRKGWAEWAQGLDEVIAKARESR
jgi:hypothetical protein